MKRTFTAIYLLLNLLITFSGANNDTDKLVDEYLKNQEIYKTKAKTLTSKAIYEQITLLLTLVPKNLSFTEGFINKKIQEAAAYRLVLNDRYENNETEAAFYCASLDWRTCSNLKKYYKGNTEHVKHCFDTVLDGFKLASRNGVAAGSYNIGTIYKEGLGVNKSNLVASKWYTIAAEQYRDMGLEDNFLNSLEKALETMPDNPKALELKKAYLNK